MKLTSRILAMTAAVSMLCISASAADIIKIDKDGNEKGKMTTPATKTIATSFKVNKVIVKDDGSTQKMLETTLIKELGTTYDKNGAAELVVSVAWSGVGINRTLVLRTNFKTDVIEKTATLQGKKPASDAAGAQLLANDAAKQLVAEYQTKAAGLSPTTVRKTTTQ